MRLFPVVLILLTGCSNPPPDPLPIRPDELARSYRGDPGTANKAYAGQSILMRLAGFRPDGGRLVWSLGLAAGSRPVIILEFAGPLPSVHRDTWITGICRGRTIDGYTRELAGYDFCVRVTDCRLASPPTR